MFHACGTVIRDMLHYQYINGSCNRHIRLLHLTKVPSFLQRWLETTNKVTQVYTPHIFVKIFDIQIM